MAISAKYVHSKTDLESEAYDASGMAFAFTLLSLMCLFLMIFQSKNWQWPLYYCLFVTGGNAIAYFTYKSDIKNGRHT